MVATAEKLRGQGICRAVLNNWFDPLLYQVCNNAALQVASPVCTCLYLSFACAGSCNAVMMCKTSELIHHRACPPHLAA